MTMVSFKSISSKELSFESTDSSYLKNVSYSPYLSSTNEITFVHKLCPIMMISTTQEKQLSLARKREEDGEIGVFGAEKYFNGRMDEERANVGARKYKIEERSDLTEPTKPSVRSLGTPSLGSESSWNSQSALMRKAACNSSLGKTTKVQRRSFLGSLISNCACSDKNSVDIDEEHVGEISFNRSGASFGAVHANPITNDPIKTVLEAPEEVHMQKMDKLGIELNKETYFSIQSPIAQKSLQVFGSPVMEWRKKPFSIETKLAKLAWKANQRALEETEVAAKGIYNNDSDQSDASSDLFEIESLTGKANPFLARQASDVVLVPAGCATPKTCYAPSETSIEWSVVTASAVDCEDQRPRKIMASPIKMLSQPAISTNMKSNKETAQRRRPSILLSCKSHKSVRVAGDAYIANDKVHADHSPRTHRGLQASNKRTGTLSSQTSALPNFTSSVHSVVFY